MHIKVLLTLQISLTLSLVVSGYNLLLVPDNLYNQKIHLHVCIIQCVVYSFSLKNKPCRTLSSNCWSKEASFPCWRKCYCIKIPMLPPFLWSNYEQCRCFCRKYCEDASSLTCKGQQKVQCWKQHGLPMSWSTLIVRSVSGTFQHGRVALDRNTNHSLWSLSDNRKDGLSQDEPWPINVHTHTKQKWNQVDLLCALYHLQITQRNTPVIQEQMFPPTFPALVNVGKGDSKKAVFQKWLLSSLQWSLASLSQSVD